MRKINLDCLMTTNIVASFVVQSMAHDQSLKNIEMKVKLQAYVYPHISHTQVTTHEYNTYE